MKGSRQSQVAERLRRARCWIEEQTWNDVAGATDWLVALTIVHLVARSWRSDLRISVRQVAELAGITKDTASASLRRLRFRGFVRRISDASGPRAARYELLFLGCPNAGTHSISPMNVPFVHAGYSDVFRHNGLNKNALRLWLFLLSHPSQNVLDLTIELGLHETTVRRNLKDLEACGLVVQAGFPARWSGLRQDLGSVAASLGTSGATKARREQHARERLNFHLMLTRKQESVTSKKAGGP